ncbi:MAG: hypothetical protein CSA66_06655 [Proteobacteria bacterium]|nr:MAG: hypothetical protein CSA66_06655 [Pseudomonadota bacterium]
MSVPAAEDGHLVEGAIVSIFDVDSAGPRLRASTRVEGLSLNLLGYLTWALRISPDGRWGAISGRLEERETTVVFDLRTGERYADFPCDGPVGFSPDSLTMVGFRRVDEGQSELVINDVLAKTSEVEPFAFSRPVYWIAPDGRRVVTYAMGERGLVITDLDLMATETVGGPEVALNEFAVGPDADFIYLVDHGALYLLDLELGEVHQLEPATRDYDNINILPGGDALILAAADTSRFELWSVVTATTESSVTLPTRR